MIVLLTGPDLAGKSTLARKLQEQLPNRVFPQVVGHKANRRHTIEELRKSLMTDLEEMRSCPKGELIIWDRWYFPEELIYEPILGEAPCRLSTEELQELEEQLQSLPVIFILVQAEREVLEERLAKRGDQYISLADYDRIFQQYQLFQRKIHIPLMVIDSTHLTPDQMCYEALDIMKRQKERLL